MKNPSETCSEGFALFAKLQFFSTGWARVLVRLALFIHLFPAFLTRLVR